MVSMRPPAGSALAIESVEKPIAVPISRTRLGASAVTSTRSNRPAAGFTIGTPSLLPVLSISSRTGPSGGWTPSRYSRSRSVVSMCHLQLGEMIQGAMSVPQPRSRRKRAREIVASRGNSIRQLAAGGQPGRNGRREGAAGAVGAGRHDPLGTILLDALTIDEQVHDRVVGGVATLDHNGIGSQDRKSTRLNS